MGLAAVPVVKVVVQADRVALEDLRREARADKAVRMRMVADRARIDPLSSKVISSSPRLHPLHPIPRDGVGSHVRRGDDDRRLVRIKGLFGIAKLMNHLAGNLHCLALID